MHVNKYKLLSFTLLITSYLIQAASAIVYADNTFHNFTIRQQTNKPAIAGQTKDEFNISKVNRIEKQWVIPPNRWQFMGSTGVSKFNYLKPLPEDKIGENYVIYWIYKGQPINTPVKLRFEYRTNRKIKELKSEEKLYDSVKSGIYQWVFENIGGDFKINGKVDRWRVILLIEDKVVAEKISGAWRALEPH